MCQECQHLAVQGADGDGQLTLETPRSVNCWFPPDRGRVMKDK